MTSWSLRIAPVLLFALCSEQAQAQAQQIVRRNESHNASGLCQGALPQFAGTLRARPLGLANEGQNDAFVSCSLLGGITVGNAPVVLSVQVFASNNGASPVAVTCTLVDGIRNGSFVTPLFFPKTWSVPAQDTKFVVWSHEEFPGAPDRIRQPNLSCKLPPGSEINLITVSYDELV
jgi:hypothetical protein